MYVIICAAFHLQAPIAVGIKSSPSCDLWSSPMSFSVHHKKKKSLNLRVIHPETLFAA